MFRARPVVALLLFAALAGCASVIPRYRAARAAALADAGPAPANWTPDAALYLGPDVVQAIVRGAVARHEHRKTTFQVDLPILGAVPVTSDLALRALSVAPSTTCEECVAVDATIGGTLTWKVGRRSRTTPVEVRAAFDTEFASTREQDGTFLLTSRPRHLRSIDLELGKLDSATRPRMQAKLRAWAEANLVDQMHSTRLGTFGGGDVPLRALRVRSAGRAIALQMLTRSPTPTSLPAAEPTVRSGWRLDVSTDSLLDLARAAAFRRGPGAHDVVVEPTALAVTPDAFDLGIRVWRPTGRGWWRDYRVHGQVRFDGQGIALVPDQVEQVAHSPWAAWVDPLAALAEGPVLDSVEGTVQHIVPASRAAGAEAPGFTATVQRLATTDGVLRVTGVLEVATPPATPG